jgi:hypothetical protein
VFLIECLDAVLLSLYSHTWTLTIPLYLSDYASALASCLASKVAYVHIPNTPDLYWRIEPRPPFAAQVEYLQDIPLALDPVSKGILLSDIASAAALIVVVAFGLLRAAYQIKRMCSAS